MVNSAVAGRSARSYYNEGKFTALADKVVAGDYVLLYAFPIASYLSLRSPNEWY